MRVMIQAPEGLKTKLLEISDEHEDAIIDCEACYGACDIKDHKAKELGCDKIIHYGHSKFVDSVIPVEYKEMRQVLDFIPILEKNIDKLPEKIGLITSVQYMDALQDVKKYLESKGKQVFMDKSERLYEAQILGCDITAGKNIEDKVDGFLYFGSGQFHPLGLALESEKPVFVLNFEMKSLDILDTDLFQRQKYAAIELFKDANVIGILVSTKKGQMNIKLAEDIKEKLKPKKSYILIMNEIRPEKLEGLKINAYINTACPRIGIDNRTEFKQPIVNWNEIKQIFK